MLLFMRFDDDVGNVDDHQYVYISGSVDDILYAGDRVMWKADWCLLCLTERTGENIAREV